MARHAPNTRVDSNSKGQAGHFKFPMTSYLVAGTQADQSDRNEVLVMKVGDLHKTMREQVDEDDSGELDKEEVVRALLKTLALTGDPTRVQMMRSTVEAIWPVFDDDGSGTIDRQEFLKANDGLADTIIATMGAPL